MQYASIFFSDLLSDTHNSKNQADIENVGVNTKSGSIWFISDNRTSLDYLFMTLLSLQSQEDYI